MVNLPGGVDINYLIDDLKIFSWEAADILLKYSKMVKKSGYLTNIIKDGDEKDPVTIADLEVNDLILNRMQRRYPYIGWKFLSEENAKDNLNNCDINLDSNQTVNPV